MGTIKRVHAHFERKTRFHKVHTDDSCSNKSQSSLLRQKAPNGKKRASSGFATIITRRSMSQTTSLGRFSCRYLKDFRFGDVAALRNDDIFRFGDVAAALCELIRCGGLGIS